MKSLSRPCPICGSRTADVLHQQSFVLPEGHPLANGYDVVACGGCGFVFADTVVTQADYDRFYAAFSKYEDGLTSTGAGETPEDAQRLHDAAEWIAASVADRSAEIADIGCANGGLLEALKKFGFSNLVGIDLSPNCVESTRKRSGIRAFQGGLGQMPVDAGPFDVIILSHVLEHIRDLRVALDSVTVALHPGGLLYVEVPDATRYKDCLVCPFQDFNTEHINHFSLKSLSALLAGVALRTSEKTGAKTLFPGSSLEYPAIFGIWKPVAAAEQRPVQEFEFDTELKDAVVEYIGLSAAMLEQLESRLAAALMADREVIVWGTGQLTMKLLAYASLGKAKIAAFVDGNPANHGKVLQGVRVAAPEQIRGLKCPIVVASLLHETAIANRIEREMGLPNEIIRLGGGGVVRLENARGGAAMIRVADYIIQKLADEGVRHTFVVTGGGAMFLNNAFAHEPRITSIFNHHEQACAMAAEGYARTSGKLGVINVTTGPGGINSLNGVFGAWTDSIPMLILSGQVKRETCLAAYDLPGLRQLGDQEVDIVRMVKGITKYATLVMDPQKIRYHLEKAMYLATHGRPGPCWLDIPVDVQSTLIDPDALVPYDPAEDRLVWDMTSVAAQCREVLRRLQTAARPVIMAGTGVRLADALDVFERVVQKLGIPVTTAWTHDLIESDSPLFCGRPGTIGDRAGNFTVQNSDALLILGSRLNIRQVSYNWKAFARHAFKMQVDVDAAELQKPTIRPDMPVHCDAKVFLEELERQIDLANDDSQRHADWLAWCKVRVARYPVVLPKHRTPDIINPYHFIDTLFRQLDDDDVVICGNATACIVTYQVATIKRGQRLLSNSGSASMGWDLPTAIGAAVARGGKRVICLAGDGSLQMNIQELQTLANYKFPIKLFVLSNGGYLSIRTTQVNFFGKRFGEGPESGVSLPDVIALAGAYGLPGVRLTRPPFETALAEVLAGPGPTLCDVVLDQSQTFEPKLSSKQLPDGKMVSAPLEDMFPFLDKEELATNLLIPPEG